MPDVAVVGDSKIHKRFLDSHISFLDELGELQELAGKMWEMTLDKYIQPPMTEPDGEELEKYTTLRLAQIIVYALARTTFDSFIDIFILAGNCRGFAAKMMLRPMYEHLVTASFIASRPEKANDFANHAAIDKWKLWIRTRTVVPQLEEMVPVEKIAKLNDLQQQVRTRLKSEICKTCKQPITQEAWTRVSVDTMAEQVDITTGTGLVKLYGPCYLVPTALIHPTSFGQQARFEPKGVSLVYNELPDREAHDALLRAHGLLLRLFRLMNTFFNLGLDAEVTRSWVAFSQIWNGALVDPSVEVAQEFPQGEKSL